MKSIAKFVFVATASFVAGISIVQFDLFKSAPRQGTAISQPIERCAMEAEKRSAEEPEISKHDVWQ